MLRRILLLVTASCCAAGCRWVMPFSSPAHEHQLDSARDIRSSDTGSSDRPDSLVRTRDLPKTERPAVQGSTTLTATRDTMIEKVGPDLNYGGCTTIYLMHTPLNPPEVEQYRVLFFFDVSSLATCRIDKATLVLTAAGTPDQDMDISLYQLTQDWVEGAACGQKGVASWLASTTTTAWTGGAFNPETPVVTSHMAQNAPFGYWEVTALVQQWVDKTTPNYGVILDTPELTTVNHVSFYTRDPQVQVAQRPKLQVDHTCYVP